MEVDVDGTISYPEPQVIAKDNGNALLRFHSLSPHTHTSEAQT